MTIRIEIFGESATDALDELKIIASALTGVAPAAVKPAGNVAVASAAPERPSPAPETAPAPTVSPSSEGVEIDAHGHPWDENLHASTKGKTKDGLWRMKVGVSRPDPLPGFPKEGSTPATGTEPEVASTSATSQSAEASGASGTAPAPENTTKEDDEFAAFHAAAAEANAKDAAAAASAPARKWTDADLGALCNQAAVKLGDPAPIKEIISQFVDGEVAHSRNIPEAKREEFAKAVEAKAGIEFAG